MAGGSTRNSGSRICTGVRVVVAGDHGTGKSSLIAAIVNEAFPEKVAPVLPPTHLPADCFPNLVPITIIDTSSSPESKFKRNEELKRADAVVLTYACDQPATRLRIYWLPELRRLKVADVFYFSQKAVLHPTAPLFDQEQRALQPRYARALRRIFILCDRDMDGALNDAELNEFQVKCFNAPIQLDEILGVKRVVQENLPAGVNHLGLTLTGFLYLHALFIERGRLETTWAVLRKFGYDDDLKLRDDFLPAPFKRAPDQSVELSTETMEFLRRIFRLFDTEHLGNIQDGSLRQSELNKLFSTAPESPWDEAPYEGAAEKTTLDENSWKKSKDLLYEVARRGEESGYGVPSLLIATKDDLDPHPMAVQDSIRVCQKLGIEAPISFGAKLNDMNNVFNRIVSAAECPHFSVPETEIAKRRKYHQQLISRSLVCVSVGAATATAGLAAYRVYAARRNTSG